MNRKHKLLLTLLFLCAFAGAQDRSFRITMAGGLSVPVWLTDVKLPGLSGRLYVEKLIDRDESRAIWFALEHTQLRPADPRTELWDPTGTTTVTKTFHSSSITTLIFGVRRWKETNLVYALGTGLGIYNQGYPFFDYSEDLLDYQQYQKSVKGWGWATSALVGWKPGQFEITINYHGVWDMFRTVNLSDDYDLSRSSMVMSFGLSVGFSF